MTTYAAAGVSLEASESLARWLRPEVGGLFGGMFPAAFLKTYDDPILISSTDGVGSKARLAVELHRVEELGRDIVHHCVNDIAVHGADPLFFLDYLAFHTLDESVAHAVIDGIRVACEDVGVKLCGGETAEMPLTYRDGQVDVAGTIVGVVEASNLIDGRLIQEGDVVLALASSGLHTNGYSLVQSVFNDSDYGQWFEGGTIGDALLACHRCYLNEIRALRDSEGVHGMAHITGGGIEGNLSRIIPDGLLATVSVPAWPPLFELIRERGVDANEMARVFNLGVGLVAVCEPGLAGAAPAGDWQQIGTIVKGGNERRVELRLEA